MFCPFNKYCNSFYGSQAWDLRSKHVQGLYKAWNRGVRRILDLPYDSHLFLLPLLLKIPSLEVQLMKRFVKMCKTMYFSEYKSVSFLFRFCMEYKYLSETLMGLTLFLTKFSLILLFTTVSM